MNKAEIEDMHKAYPSVCNMKLPEQVKRRMLGDIFSCHEQRWRVEGITGEALRIFKENGFKKRSRMRINRSHKTPRYVTSSQMLKEPMAAKDSWWKFYIENDGAVFAKSSEGMKNNHPYLIDFKCPENLFLARGYGWRNS